MQRVFGFIILLSLLVPGAPACGDDDGLAPIAPRPRGTDRVGGMVVATVDGVGITISDVEGLARSAAVTPARALADLIDTELLAAEARRRGYGDRRATRAARARARVRRLLSAHVEEVVTAASIPDAEIMARYERDAPRYHQEERRRSRHLLVRVPDDGDAATWALAEARAQELLREALAVAPDVDSVFQAATAPAPLRIRTESLDPVARDGSFQAEYEEALFATDPGEVYPGVVRTSFGMHVVLVEEVVPALHVSLQEATPGIRADLVVENRAARTAELLRRLGEARSIEVIDAVYA
ncbi:MAG: peptidyl-prolyl cis-trans isomerase, partial [Deltaproteobacteria bacterium]|nr:peptidyl-prolyl cis-trans isomerase [Deltaproteobacteria bacterium]